MCIRQHSAPLLTSSSTIAGSPRSALTSLTSPAPAAIAARATAALVVSIETSGRVGQSLAAMPSSTGSTRRSSSSATTGCAPGRVDSPPMSRMSAPSATSSRACAIAARGSRNAPPSENESGVTFTTPIRR